MGQVMLEPERPEDAGFMALAIAQGKLSAYPFGTVIVRDGVVIESGRNMGAERGDPTAHGEMVAIWNTIASHGAAALRGATLYTNGEPCPMCMGAILWCGIGRLVYAASIEMLATRMNQIMVPSTVLASAGGFAPITITGGVLAEQAIALF